MRVSAALRARYSCRAYLPDAVPAATVRAILTDASRAPSGGNLQPWRVWTVAGDALHALCARVMSRIDAGSLADGEPEYFVYPPELKEPYATRRFETGEAFYGALSVERDDYPARLRNYRSNFEFFGAPVGLIFAIDRSMQQGQWADLGMFMQSIMLLAKARGLDTVALESWSFWHETVREALGIPQELIVFCGMALGRADPDAAVNAFRTERAALSEFAAFAGFDDDALVAPPAATPA